MVQALVHKNLYDQTCAYSDWLSHQPWIQSLGPVVQEEEDEHCLREQD